jgi:DNA-binding PadR family transcriptional regulator
MPRNHSQLEVLVLLAIAKLAAGAFGSAIRDELLISGGRDVSVAAVYAALDRLERDGLIRAELTDPRPERGGRARRQFSLSQAGEDALREEYAIFSRLWAAAPAGVKGGRP